MTKEDALDLAAQLGITDLPKRGTANAFADEVERRGMTIKLERPTGDWVILDAAGNEVARRH